MNPSTHKCFGSVSVLINVHTNPNPKMYIHWQDVYTGYACAGVNRKYLNNNSSPTHVNSCIIVKCRIYLHNSCCKDNRVSNACNWISMLRSTLAAEPNVGCSLPEEVNVIGAWRIGKSYIVTEKTQSERGCECLHHRCQTSLFLPVKIRIHIHTHTQSFQSKSGCLFKGKHSSVDVAKVSISG